MHTNHDLREALFDAIAGLKNGSVDVSTAKAISDLSQTIINSAKLEIDYARQCGADMRSAFIEQGHALPALPASPTGRRIIKARHVTSNDCIGMPGQRGASSLEA